MVNEIRLFQFFGINPTFNFHRYKIYRDTVDGLQGTLLTTVDSRTLGFAVDNFYEDSGLTLGTTYYYRITINNGGGFDAPLTDPIPLKSALPPLQVPRISLSSTVSSQVVVTWTPPAYNGDLITKYMIKSVQGAGVYVEIANTATTYTFMNENSDNARLFHIVAVNSVQPSAVLACNVCVATDNGGCSGVLTETTCT